MNQPVHDFAPHYGQCNLKNLLQLPEIRQIPSPKIQLYECKNFLPAPLCEQLIAMIDRDCAPSRIMSPEQHSEMRTSSTCVLPDSSRLVGELELHLLRASGIDPRYGEQVQGQRYLEGQEYKAHVDFFPPLDKISDSSIANGGQRSWTFMVYLNRPEAGGGTRFRALKKTFQPEVGKLLCWNNIHANGTGNVNTLHQALKLRKGRKYVITKWYRQRPWNRITL